MKCMQCPLLAADNSLEDWDVICLADTERQNFPEYKNGFEFESGGCRRTNRWILEQNPEALKNEYWKKEAKRWEAYAEKEAANHG